jgi:hypothetical protein
MLVKQHVVDSHFIAVDCEETKGLHAVNKHLYWKGYYSLLHILCCTVFGINVCNLTEFMIPNMAHNIYLVA